MGGSPEPFLWDHDLQAPRSPTKADMVACTRLGQALAHIDFVMALCSAGDMPPDVQRYHEYDAILRNTTKPVIYSAPGCRHAAALLEMAAAVSGGEDSLRRRPSIVLFTQPVSPLQIGPYSEGMIEAAALGVPVLASPGPMMGATSPTTLAGTLVQVIAVAQLGRFYGLPTFGLGGGVEAKLPDAEAAAQATMGMLLNALAGLTLTQTLGTLASGLYGSAEMLLICNEIARMITRVQGGIAVTDKTLAADVIREVGPGGSSSTKRTHCAIFERNCSPPSCSDARASRSGGSAGRIPSPAPPTNGCARSWPPPGPSRSHRGQTRPWSGSFAPPLGRSNGTYVSLGMSPPAGRGDGGGEGGGASGGGEACTDRAGCRGLLASRGAGSVPLMKYSKMASFSSRGMG